MRKLGFMGRRTRGRRNMKCAVRRSNKRQGHQTLEVRYRQAPPISLVTERLKVATIEDQYPIRAMRRSTPFARREAILLSCKKEHRGNIATRSAMPSPQREGAPSTQRRAPHSRNEKHHTSTQQQATPRPPSANRRALIFPTR